MASWAALLVLLSPLLGVCYLIIPPVLPLTPLFWKSSDIDLDFPGTQLTSLKAKAILLLFILRAISNRIARLLPGKSSSTAPKAPLQSVTMPFSLTSRDISTFNSITGRLNNLDELSRDIPLLQSFLSSLMAPSIILLLAKRGAGIDALGSVNVRNTFHTPDPATLVAALHQALDKPTDLRIRAAVDLGARRKVKRGWEMDIHATLLDGDTTLHSMKFTMLSLFRHRSLDNLHTRPSDPDLKYTAQGSLKVSEEDVKYWVDLSKDANPIHTSHTLARLFGLKGKIAHGNLVVTKAITFIDLPKYTELEMEFLRPVHVPAKLEIFRAEDRIELRQKDKPLISITCK